MHWDILDQKRKDILPILGGITVYNFYLAGGTALALQIGHRDSIDFDFFTEVDIDTEKLFDHISELFGLDRIVKVQEEKNTLGIIVDNEIKISFMSYKYKMIKPFVNTDYFKMASILDIACMKCSAISSRSAMKDYVDMYFILKDFTLSDVLKYSKEKLPTLDTNLILKSLVYFDDIEKEEIIYKNQMQISFEEIKSSLRKKVLEIK